MGEGGNYYFAVITVLYFGATFLARNLVCSRELHEEVACYRDKLRINCGDHSFIAIHEAFFTTALRDSNDTTCGGPSSVIEHEHHAVSFLQDEEESCYEDIRVSINKMCSGARSCLYSYQDKPNKVCPNLRGQFIVRYDCVRNSSVVNYCNRKLENREGYFSSPGFPAYYPKLSQCAWTLSSLPGQTILLKVLHLHLRAPTQVYTTPADPDSLYILGILGHLTQEADSRCELDALTIVEGTNRVNLCGEGTDTLRTVEIEEGSAEVNFKSTSIVPASGFLMYYKVQGCPALQVSKDVRLIEGNGSLSVFTCTGDKVFNDTLEAERVLSCVRDHHWNDTLAECVALDDIATTTATAPVSSPEGSTEAESDNDTLPTPEKTTSEIRETAYLEDIIVPSILIGILIIGNAIIIATILLIRRRQKAKLAEEENGDDLKTEPLVSGAKDV